MSRKIQQQIADNLTYDLLNIAKKAPLARNSIKAELAPDELLKV